MVVAAGNEAGNETDAVRQITRLRRSCRYEEAERAIGELLGPVDEQPAAQVELGRIAMDRNRPGQGLARFESALALDPDFELALAWRVAALSRLRRYREAFEAADEALRRDPHRHLVRVALAQTWRDERGGYRRALEELDRVLDHDPAYLEALEGRIAILDDLARYDESERQAAEAIRLHPEAPELLVMSSFTLHSQGRYQDAVKRCEQALELHPEYVWALRTRIQHLLDAMLVDEAREEAERAVARMPWVGELHFTLAQTFSVVHAEKEALAEFDRALELEPDDDIYHVWRMWTLDALGRREEAHAAIRQARERLPHSVAVAVAQARLHGKAGETTEALNALEEAAALYPLNSQVLTWRIAILRDLRRYAEAERLARTAIESRPDDAKLRNDLGWIYADQDKDEDALFWFQQANELQPHTETFIRDVARALRWLNRPDEAETVLREACQTMTESPILLTQLGITLEEQGRYDEALDEFTKLTENWPRYFAGWQNTISMLLERGRFADAERSARRGIERNPDSATLRTYLVRVCDEQGQDEKAIDLLRDAYRDLPHSTFLARELASALDERGKTDEALALLAGLADEEPTQKLRIRLLRNAGRYDEAMKLAAAEVANDPANVDFRIELGETHADLGADEAALAEFEAALTVDPLDRNALLSRVFALRRLRRYDEAERVLLAEIARRPNYPSLYLELGRTYWQAGRPEDALAQYERGLRIRPRGYRLHSIRANALRLAGKLEEAEAALAKALELFPTSPGLRAEMGLLRDAQNRYEEALEWFDKALATAPRAIWILTGKSATLRSLGRFTEAERILEPALRRWPRDLELLEEWGWVLRDRGQLTRARKVFEKSRNLAVNNWEKAGALHGLGWVAFTGNDLAAARRYFAEALQEEPHSVRAKLGLAWTLVRQAEPEGEAEAERLCYEVLDEKPRQHSAHTCLGVLYAQQRDLPQAEYHLRRSIEIDPFNGSYVDLGALLVQMNRFDEARELLEKALDRNWYDSQAHLELGGLYLQQDFGEQDEDHARRAVRHFRQALVIDPARGAAAIGLALGLVKSSGDLIAAERVLRDALARPHCDQPRWQLLVALARLLIERADATQRRDLHLEALGIAQQAIELASEEADPYYVAGIAAFKAGESGSEVQARPFYRRRALRYLRLCLRHDAEHAEARRVMLLAEQSLAVTRKSLVGSAAIVAVASVLLVALWLGFFFTDKVTAVMIGTLTPVLAGLVAIGFVLLFLVRLRLPGGVEADLSASLNQVSTGPTGEVSIGPGRLVGHGIDGSSALSPLSTGPRGELPRLG